MINTLFHQCAALNHVAAQSKLEEIVDCCFIYFDARVITRPLWQHQVTAIQAELARRVGERITGNRSRCYHMSQARYPRGLPIINFNWGDVRVRV